MKIAFFSDVHGNQYAYFAFKQLLQKNEVDKLVFCGDIFGYYYGQREILEDFSGLENLTCIKGNHDQMFLDLKDGLLSESFLVDRYGNSYRKSAKEVGVSLVGMIRNWPTSLEITVDGSRIGVFHGSVEKHIDGRVYPDTLLENEELYERYQYVVLGHTHHKMIRKVGQTTILNPGSLGQQRDGQGCSFLILDTIKQEFQFHIVQYEVQNLLWDIKRYDNGNERLKEVLLRNKQTFNPDRV